MKCTHIYAAQTTYFNTSPDFPCLADEIAKLRPDMNIKVAAFTESKQFYYTAYYDKKVLEA